MKARISSIECLHSVRAGEIAGPCHELDADFARPRWQHDFATGDPRASSSIGHGVASAIAGAGGSGSGTRLRTGGIDCK